MTEQPKKPRNIKDLKARLGKTVPTGPATGGGPVPPPAMGGPVPGVVPPPSAPSSVLPGVAPPPFARPQSTSQAPAASSDPFAAAARSAGPQEYRIVYDEKSVDDSEVGRKSRMRGLLTVGVGLILGLAVGAGAGSVNSDNKLWNLGVRDGKELYTVVHEASTTVSQAKRLVDQAIAAAKGAPGKAPAVDYAAIEQLRALEKPITANAFSQKQYGLFRPATVDNLFTYYNNVNLSWEDIGRLDARTRSPQRRQALDAAATAASEMATNQTGCVPTAGEGEGAGVFCGLVYVTVPPPPAEGAEAPTEVQVAATPRGRSVPKTLYRGQDLTDNPSQYVILTDTVNSVGVLGQAASVFAEYQRDLIQMKALLDKTVEIQGQLEKDLGDIARHDERFSF